MEPVHVVVIPLEIALEQGHTAGHPHVHVGSQGPLLLLRGLALIGGVSLSGQLRVVGPGPALRVHLCGHKIRQLVQGHGRPLRRGVQNVQIVHIPHGGQLPQGLVQQDVDHVIDLILVLLPQGGQLFAVQPQTHAVVLGLFRPHLHVLGGDVLAVHSQAEAAAPGTAHQDIPPVQQLLGGALLEVSQLEQPGPVPLGDENQLVLLPVVAQLKGHVGEGGGEQLGTPVHQLPAYRLPVLLVHQGPQFPLPRQEGAPALLGPSPEGSHIQGQGQALLAAVNELQRVLVPGAGLQGLLEVGQGQALLVQVVVGVGNSEIPGVGHIWVLLCRLLQLALQRQQQVQGPLVQGPVLRRHHVNGQVVVGPGQGAGEGEVQRLLGQGLDGVDDLLVFVLLVPLLQLV